MSGFKPVGTELLYSVTQAATNSTPTTTPGSSAIVGWPPITIPAGYFDNASGSWSKTLKLCIGGLVTPTTTIPTFSFGLYTTTAVPAVWAATNLMYTASTAVTPTTASATAQPFYWESHIGLRTMGAAGANSTIVSQGWFESPLIPTTGIVWMPTTGAGTMLFTTYDPAVQYFLWPTISLGAATAGNFITPQWGKLYGED